PHWLKVLGGMGRTPLGSGESRGKARCRRGRPSKDDTVRLVISLVRADLSRLEGCTTLADYPGVRTLVRRHQHRVLPLGISLKALFDPAVADVLALTSAVNAHSYKRMAVFLNLWYLEERPVTEVARHLQLERTHVVKTVQRPALDLVARRFLALAGQ